MPRTDSQNGHTHREVPASSSATDLTDDPLLGALRYAILRDAEVNERLILRLNRDLQESMAARRSLEHKSVRDVNWGVALWACLAGAMLRVAMQWWDL